MALHVIITAGGELPTELHAVSDARVKALLRLGEHTLLERAVEAAAGSALVDNIAVVGNDAVLRAMPPAAAHVAVGKTAVDNLYNGFLHHGGGLEDEYFVLSPDLPFITTTAVDEFIGAARVESQMAFPVISADDFHATFPGTTNKFERLDGRFVTMGSCIYITGQMLKTNIPLFNDFFVARRKPLKLAAMLGLPIALAYLTGRARLAQVEARARQLTGGNVRGVAVRAATLAFDVDKRVDYDYAIQHLQKIGSR
jgi:GTP:adenosylcobinamide-phosphate guanylyltransferase